MGGRGVHRKFWLKGGKVTEENAPETDSEPGSESDTEVGSGHEEQTSSKRKRSAESQELDRKHGGK